MIILCEKINCRYFNKDKESNCSLDVEEDEVALICIKNNHKYYVVKEKCYEVLYY